MVLNQDPWRKLSAAKEVSTPFTLHSNTGNTGYNKITGLQDINITSASTGSNHSEISRAMEKISETYQLLAQQQMAQQKALQALLYHQEQTSEVQEASQRIQNQALMALTKATQQRGFDPLFNKIAKYDRKDPEKCHYWLNQVRVACMESGSARCLSLVSAVSGPFTSRLAVCISFSWFSRSEVCAFVLGNICERCARRDLC